MSPIVSSATIETRSLTNPKALSRRNYFQSLQNAKLQRNSRPTPLNKMLLLGVLKLQVVFEIAESGALLNDTDHSDVDSCNCDNTIIAIATMTTIRW
ncbi:hypothetical protein CEXT_462901 [Caerostris extrusa]|uniref:Uncharacterized protein n=1 Tax=Caerostris extrusa TaxID=172846 RepID=A0AAV4TGU9_CAEEX|nr:hypothetical protein CEXT_462901 [Caerostris extrusa]